MMSSLQSLIDELEQDRSLDEPHRLRERVDALDRLDAHQLDGPLPPSTGESMEAETHRRARALCDKLEAVNFRLYKTIREEIQRGSRPDRLLQHVPKSGETSGPESLASGEGYDYLDELVSGVLNFERPDDLRVQLAAEMVAYQPTPARHIFDLISRAAITERDVLVDLGSGLGHVPLLVSICTGARCIGIEFEPAYVACARQCAEKLNLDRVSFLEQDARDADFSNGTVFYLYTPFTGSILQAVMNSLRQQAALRPIKICTFGPCTPAIAQECWLEATGPGKTSPGTETTTPETDQISVFLFRT